MGLKEAREALDDDDMEQYVVEYLQRHPNFLIQHPELLATLEVGHACGGAVSLIEHQVAVLREQNHTLRHRLHGLFEVARDNERLNESIHRLSMDLIRCDGLAQLFTVLYETLQEGFGAELVNIRIYAEPKRAEDTGLAELCTRDEQAAGFLEDLKRSAGPICGRLRREHLQIMFDSRSDKVGSGVLLAIGEGEPFGVVAIGAQSERRFHPGMGKIFLRQLGEIAGCVIRPYLKESSQSGP